MITLTKAISLLDKQVWVVWCLNPRYGRVSRGVVSHITIHSEKINRGEWHAYVSTKESGMEYDGNSIFPTKQAAESEMNSRMAQKQCEQDEPTERSNT